MASPLPTPPVLVFGYPDCGRTADVLARLRRADVPHRYEALARPAGADDDCGYVSPTVEIAGVRGRPTVLVQPTDAELLGALARAGLARSRRPEPA